MVALEVEGLKELRTAIRRLKDVEVDVAMKLVNERFAKKILALAEPNVPRRTGQLLRTLRAAGTKADAIGRVGAASAKYAPIVHWKYGPPFLTDAAAAVEQEAVDDYDKGLADVIDRVVGR